MNNCLTQQCVKNNEPRANGWPQRVIHDAKVSMMSFATMYNWLMRIIKVTPKFPVNTSTMLYYRHTL